VDVSGPTRTLGGLLSCQAERSPDAPAILAPGRPPLTYARLHAHVEDVGRTLRALGIGVGDRVAVVLPNGPEMAVAAVALASHAACAPLNPAYGAEELDRCLADLRPRALLTSAGVDSPARRIAAARGISVVELEPRLDAEAGVFTLAVPLPAGAATPDTIAPDDVALLLLTSATTSRAKIVPLTHANVRASASASRTALGLTAADRCVNVLPLFHGHGLIATLLASLDAGAGIVCSPGPDVARFFGWLADTRATWYSAVPTIHQAILGQALRDPDRVPVGQLRLIRSGSAPLRPRVLAELERTFEAPVIEFYGMTEVAAAPIACNPLPPGRRKPGSVGVPADLDVAILDARGRILPRGQSGEVGVRGASVMRGYDAASVVDAGVFAEGGWFRTGDLGVFDHEGFLFLTGRSKEIINRGGEKIAPQEVDDALMDHPAVARAVSFAVPHATLGEDVGAAVVLRPHASATARDLRRFARSRLADFKVPRQILIVPGLPASATGKVARIGLAERLGLTTGAAMPEAAAGPRTPLEARLAALWAELLDVESVGIHDDFFASGGDSLLATQLLARVHDLLAVEASFSAFFDAPTIAAMADHVATLGGAGAARPAATAAPVRARVAPTSVAQEHVWRLQRALPDLPFFNVLYAVQVRGPVKTALLQASLGEIARRHEILRTTFDEVDGRSVQVIAPARSLPLVVDDLRDLPEAAQAVRGQALLSAEALEPFDLGRGPLMRARLVRWDETEGTLVITLHQAIVDGWSLGVLIGELAALYDAFASGSSSPLAPLGLQWADVAGWQRQWASGEAGRAQLAYWTSQLRGPWPALELVTDHPRGAGSDLRTARRPVALPRELVDRLGQASRREGATVFMLLVTALVILLRRELGQDDVRVATLVANRNRPGTGELIGPLVNTVVLRAHVSGDLPLRDLIQRIRATTLAAYANQDLPFEELVPELERLHGITPRSLSPVMLVLQNATLRPRARSAGPLELEEANPAMSLPLVAATTFDVVLNLHETDEGLTGSCVYKADLFEASTIDRIVDRFRRVLERVAGAPEQPVSAVAVCSDGNV
jgi:acyl-CoA synthetase (AMP-forming)/AMP-acid ligase II